MLIPDSVLAQLTKRDPAQTPYVVIHHSVAPQTWNADQIAAAESFLTIGYNAYVRLNDDSGAWQVEQGRPMIYVPAAQYGLNAQGYAICIAGNYQPGGASWIDAVSPAALDAAASQIHAARENGLGAKFLIGHRDVATFFEKTEGVDQATASAAYGTLCPGDLLYAQLDKLRAMTGLAKPPWLA